MGKVSRVEMPLQTNCHIECISMIMSKSRSDFFFHYRQEVLLCWRSAAHKRWQAQWQDTCVPLQMQGTIMNNGCIIPIMITMRTIPEGDRYRQSWYGTKSTTQLITSQPWLMENQPWSIDSFARSLYWYRVSYLALPRNPPLLFSQPGETRLIWFAALTISCCSTATHLADCCAESIRKFIWGRWCRSNAWWRNVVSMWRRE